VSIPGSFAQKIDRSRRSRYEGDTLTLESLEREAVAQADELREETLPQEKGRRPGRPVLQRIEDGQVVTYYAPKRVNGHWRERGLVREAR
jgi:hypothetical protein